jgi:cytochrome d ubiquinol oxidase subunit I
LLLQNPEDKSAFHAYKWAAILGLSGSLLLCIGDNTPASDQLVQSRKLAALNGDQANQRLPDIEAHIRTGIKAYNLLQMLRDDDKNPTLLSDFNHMKQDLGYALLVQRWTAHIDQADDKQISLAAKFCSPPNPTVIYWGYRFMLASAILSLVIFCLAGWRSIGQNRPQVWLMKTAYYLLPAPWLACMSGWFVSEAGKQPWAIAGILPSFLSNSSLTVSELLMSLSTSTIAYILLLAVFFYLMRENISRHISAQGTLT